MEWEEIVNGKPFIMDLGNDLAKQSKSCRYAAWIPDSTGAGHRIAEVGNDVQMLKEKYQVPDEMVMRVRT